MRLRPPVPSKPTWKKRPSRFLFLRQQRSASEGDEIVTAFRDGEVTLRSRRRTEGFTNAVQEIGYQGIRKGDLVIHSMDGFAGAIGISDSDGKASPVVHAYAPAPNVDGRFYAYLLRDLARSGYITSLAKGIRERSTSFDSDMFRSMVLPVPSLEEQIAIADYLDTETAQIDALIAKKRRMIELIEERWRSESAYWVLRGLDPIIGEGKVPDGWKVVHLGVLLALHRGFDLPADNRLDGPVPVISSGGISGSHSEKACDGPGVVTGRYGTIGEAFFVEGSYWPLNTTLFVSEFRGNDAKWVYYLLSAMPLDIDSAKSAVTGINRNVIGTLWAPRPPLECQSHIAEHLDAKHRTVDRSLKLVRCQIELLRKRRQALITAAVTGELKILATETTV